MQAEQREQREQREQAERMHGTSIALSICFTYGLFSNFP